MNEKQITGVSYILTFFKEVQQITHTYAQYVNLMLELETKYNKDVDKIPEEERAILTGTMQLIRQSAHKVYIQYVAISESGKLKKDKEITSTYKPIKKNLIINRDDIEKFVIALNKVLVTDIMQEILANSQSLIGNIYDNETAS